MKKITFILLGLISGTAFAQISDGTATATVSADIVSPLTLVNNTALAFGQITNTGGDVVVLAAADATATGNVVGTAASHAAKFTVNAALNYTYLVTIPETFSLENQTTEGSSMDVVLDHNSTEMGKGEDEEFYVGGTLDVTAGQAVGHYEGTMTVTVAYQ